VVVDLLVWHRKYVLEAICYSCVTYHSVLYGIYGKYGPTYRLRWVYLSFLKVSPPMHARTCTVCFLSFGEKRGGTEQNCPLWLIGVMLLCPAQFAQSKTLIWVGILSETKRTENCCNDLLMKQPVKNNTIVLAHATNKEHWTRCKYETRKSQTLEGQWKQESEDLNSAQFCPEIHI
jgi:hypothetical protein